MTQRHQRRVAATAAAVVFIVTVRSKYIKAVSQRQQAALRHNACTLRTPIASY